MLNHASRFLLNKVRIEILRAYLFWFHIAKSKSLFKIVGVFLEDNQIFYRKMDSRSRLLLKLRFLKLRRRRFMLSYCNWHANLRSYQRTAFFCTWSINIALFSLFHLLGPRLAIAALLQYLSKLINGRRDKEIISNSGRKASSSRKGGRIDEIKPQHTGKLAQIKQGSHREETELPLKFF